MEMAEGTLPVWVILAIVGFIVLSFIAYSNYYLPKIDKLKAQCLKDKSARQRNNNILRLKRHIDEGNYSLMTFATYMVVSICFCIENYRNVFFGEHLLLSVLIVFGIWLAAAIVVVCIMTALMMTFQDNAIKDLKAYYHKHYGVTVVYITRDNEKEYYEYSEL